MPRDQERAGDPRRLGLPALHRIESSSLRAIGYDADHARLVIEFTGGGCYVYYGVPASAYRELLAADSPGRYVNTVIKPRYPAEPLDS